ncbi:unnamed protein product, partial [Heterotrigona itama]
SLYQQFLIERSNTFLHCNYLKCKIQREPKLNPIESRLKNILHVLDVFEHLCYARVKLEKNRYRYRGMAKKREHAKCFCSTSGDSCSEHREAIRQEDRLMDTGGSSGWFAFSCSARLTNNGRWLELMRHQFPVMLAVIGSADQNADLYERDVRYRSGSLQLSSYFNRLIRAIQEFININFDRHCESRKLFDDAEIYL